MFLIMFLRWHRYVIEPKVPARCSTGADATTSRSWNRPVISGWLIYAS